MTLLAIDPGPVRSALCAIDDHGVISTSTLDNAQVLAALEQAAHSGGETTLVIEMIASYGMPVGAEVFETCVWIGRFLQSWAVRGDAHRLTRVAIKSHLCHSAKAKDANIRQALIDRYGGPDQLRKGGRLYRIKGDEWAALAVAATWTDQQEQIHT